MSLTISRNEVLAQLEPLNSELLAQLGPLPNSARTDVTQPLYRATTPPRTPLNIYFPENAVPMNSVLLNSATINGDSLEPMYIAQAALEANSSVQFIVPTQVSFESLTDPNFLDERRRIADRLGVPVDQVILVRADMAAWPQDELLAGRDGIIKPGANSDRSSSPSPRGLNPNEHWTWAKRTLFGPNDFASELSLPINKANAVGRGGDTHILVRDRDGEQVAFFSAETVIYTAETHGIDHRTDAGHLRALGIAMKELGQAGVPLENIAPVGFSDKTYGEVLDALTPEQRRMIDPHVMVRFGQLRNLTFPQNPYHYHADVTMFTPDGSNMFVSEDTAAVHPDLVRQLQFFGYETHRLPAGHDSPMFGASTSYTNMVMGLDPKTGQLIILMPTQSLDPSQPTSDDIRARDILQKEIPNARIIPIGGRSALTGFQIQRSDDSLIDRNWGAHCLSNVLPYVITPR